MLAILLGKLFSPTSVIVMAVIAALGGLTYVGVSAFNGYVAVEQANTVLQDNVTTLNKTLDAERTSAKQSQAIATSSLASVQQQAQSSAQQAAANQALITKLQQLKVMPNANGSSTCASSPYVADVLNELRLNAAPSPDSTGGAKGNAAPPGKSH